MRKLLMLVLLFAVIFISGCHFFEETVPIVSPETAYVVTVGVENGYAGECPGAAVDCNRMEDLLEPYAKKQVSLVNSKATKASVVAALMAGVKYNLVIFYFSGHGGSFKSYSDKTEGDGYDECICLFDTYMMDDEIWNIISQYTGRVVLIFDCCHSGTMYRSPFVFAKQAKKLKATSIVDGPVRLLCWSGCPDSSYSYGDGGGGYLTNTLLKNFSRSKTYNSLWNKIESDKSLMKYEIVQRTIMGTDFGSKKVFQ